MGEASGVIASAEAIVAFTGVGSDAAARDVLAEAGAVPALLAHLYKGAALDEDGRGLTTDDPPVDGPDTERDDDTDDGDRVLDAVVQALAHLAFPAMANGEGADKVLE